MTNHLLNSWDILVVDLFLFLWEFPDFSMGRWGLWAVFLPISIEQRLGRFGWGSGFESSLLTDRIHVWYCWWLKSQTTTWDGAETLYLNNGENYQPQLVQDFSHQQYVYFYFYGKCRQIYHRWILWVRIQCFSPKKEITPTVSNPILEMGFRIKSLSILLSIQEGSWILKVKDWVMYYPFPIE